MNRTTWMLAAVALLIGFGPSAPPVRAGYIVTLTEQNGNVVATGTGTLDLTGLHRNATALDLVPQRYA